MASVRDIQLARKLKKAGFQNSLRTVWEARRAKLPLSYAMAFLDKESNRGHNLFGSDPVANSVKGGKVTKARYVEYKRQRKLGRGMQGVGPMQLTWYSYQDAADAMGGCWKPKYNLRVGFKLAADKIKRHGTYEGVRRYNGDGPASYRYADDWKARQAKWHRYLTS
jgi:hypothetical protein